MRQIIQALLAILALLVIALVSALVTMRLAIHGTEVRVPTLAGLTLADAASQLHSHGLETGIDGHFYSTTQPVGHILTQSPAPGMRVRKSWRVRLTISLGPQKVAIPQVQGMDQSIATITIRRTGLELGNIVAIPDGYAAENIVIAQSPQARATDVQSPTIALLIAQPPLLEEDASVMPDFTGGSFTTAALTILHAGFKVAPLKNPAGPKPPPLPARPTPTPTPTHSATHTHISSPPLFPAMLTPPPDRSAPPPVAHSPAPVPPPAAPVVAAPVVAAPAQQPSVAPGTVIAQIPTAGSRIPANAIIHLTVQP